MSTLGALSHAYAEWNKHLTEMNDWLLNLRKMKDGLIPAEKTVDIPEDVRIVLTRVAETFDPTSTRITSAIPLSIKHQLTTRLGNQVKDVTQRLANLLQADTLSLDDISDNDIAMLLTIVFSLDSEVTSLYSQMHRYR